MTVLLGFTAALAETALSVADQAQATSGVALVKGQSAAEMAVQLVQLVLSLGVVIGFIFAIAWFVKRQQGFGLQQKNIRFVERLSLGPKDQLVLVDVAGERLLLGVNAGGIQKLHEYPVPQDDVMPADSEFSGYLNKIMQKKVAQ